MNESKNEKKVKYPLWKETGDAQTATKIQNQMQIKQMKNH